MTDVERGLRNTHGAWVAVARRTARAHRYRRRRLQGLGSRRQASTIVNKLNRTVSREILRNRVRELSWRRRSFFLGKEKVTFYGRVFRPTLFALPCLGESVRDWIRY